MYGIQDIKPIMNCASCASCASCANNLNQNVNNTNQNKTLNPEIVANQFLIEYYRGVSNIGWNTVAYLFDINCIVCFKEKLFSNFYNFINYFSNENIKRANYGFIRSKWFVISNDIMLINTVGTIQLVSYNNSVTSVFPFSETFILKIDRNNVVKGTNHIIDIINN